MLQLSDAALARLIRATRAVPHNRRRKWLRELAHQIEPRELSAHAWATRQWRAREKAGRIQLRLEADEADIVISLVEAGWLDPLKADDRAAISQAAQRIITEFCEGGMSRTAVGVRDSLGVRLLLTALRKAVQTMGRKRNAAPQRRRRRPAGSHRKA